MYRERTKNLRNVKHSTMTVENNMGGLAASGSRYKLAKNSYVDSKNVVLSDRGGFKKRRTASQLGVEPDSSTDRIYGIEYHKEFGYIRVKGSNIQTLSSPGATWTTISSLYTITDNNYVDFIHFKATKTTGAISKTTTEISAERYLKIANMIPSEYIGKLLKIGNEVKLIIGNTSSVLYIQEKFEGEYALGTVVEIVDQVSATYIISPGQNVKIWRGGTSIETLDFSFDRAVLQSYGSLRNNGRLFAIKNDGKVYVSEVGSGEFFQKDSYLPVGLNGNLVGLSVMSGRVVVYSDFGRVSIIGDNPDSFSVLPNLSHKGCIAPGSIAQGNNIEFYLSHEGIEFLNSIENATVTEGISMSDGIKKKFERHTDFSSAHGTISNGKYHLSIQDWVYIYDLEKSVKFHKPVFLPAQYEECSQVQVNSAVIGQWTCSTDINGVLVFGQGGFVYQITDEKIGQLDPQKQLNYFMEFPKEYMGDLRLTKAIQKYRIFLQNDLDVDLEVANTNIKVYLKLDDGDFEIIREVDNIFEIECFISKKAKSYQIKIVLEDMEVLVDDLEFIYSELEFNFFTKK